MKKFFHITTKEEWEKAKKEGFYKAASLETEGFIHNSKAEQVSPTLERHFKGKKNLVLLVINESMLEPFVKYEEAHGELYPHLFKPLPVSAVIEVKEIPDGDNLRNIKLHLLCFLFFFSQCLFALPRFDRWFDFDPQNIIVEDPNVTLLAELPRGDINLKVYRATAEDIAAYSKEYKIVKGDLKDNPKVPNCTRAEVDAVRLWQTNDVYPMVNKILRTAQKGKMNGVPVDPKYENIILMIASASNCGPSYEGPAIRGENLPDFLLNQYQVGNYLGMRGFTSTSKGDDLTYWFEEHSKQRVYIEKVKGADFDAFGVATWPEEHEVLIRPGTVFKVLSKKKTTNSKYIQWDFEFSQF